MFVRGRFPEDYECEEKEDAASFFVVGGLHTFAAPPNAARIQEFALFQGGFERRIKG